MQKRPMLITITIAVKVVDRPLMFRKRRVVKGRTCRERQTEQVTPY